MADQHHYPPGGRGIAVVARHRVPMPEALENAAELRRTARRPKADHVAGWGHQVVDVVRDVLAAMAVGVVLVSGVLTIVWLWVG